MRMIHTSFSTNASFPARKLLAVLLTAAMMAGFAFTGLPAASAVSESDKPDFYVGYSALPPDAKSTAVLADTIQNALNTAETGAVVAVAAGNYDEALTISKQVKLYGPNSEKSAVGANWTDGSRAAEARLTGGIAISDAFTGSLEIKGFYFTAKGIVLSSPAVGVGAVTIENNQFGAIVSGSAISLGGTAEHPVTGLVISGNRFANLTGGCAINACFIAGSTVVSGNFIRNTAGSAMSFGAVAGVAYIGGNRIENWSAVSTALLFGTVEDAAMLTVTENLLKTVSAVGKTGGHYGIGAMGKEADAVLDYNYWGGKAPTVADGMQAGRCGGYYLDEAMTALNGFKVTIPVGIGYTVGIVPGCNPDCAEFGKAFRFVLALGTGYSRSVPAVTAGGQTLTPDINGIYTIPNVTADVTDLAVSGVVPNGAELIYSAPAHGTLSVRKADGTAVPSGTVLPYGTVVTVTATPDSGYKLKSLTVGGVHFESGGSFTVSDGGEIVAVFEVSVTYRIAVSVGSNGTASQGSADVEAGTAYKIVFTPDVGCEVSSVLIDGADIGRVGSYTFGSVSAAHTVDVTFKAAGTKATAADFTDLTPGIWYYSALDAVVGMGIMNGMSATQFLPTGPVTRGMFVTMLWRLEGSPASDQLSAFTDVGSGKYYVQSVAWASRSGIAQGYSAVQFGPDNNVTREQAAVMFYHFAKYKGAPATEADALESFSDRQSLHDWALGPMQWAVAKGLIAGRPDGTLDPLANLTRAEAAVTLKRYIDLGI